MLMMCGVFYLCLSVWGIIQLTIMGIMYRLEATNLIEDAEAHRYENLKDFVMQTKENYKKCGRNCFIAAGLYVLVLLSAGICISHAKKDEKKRAAALLDDDLRCTVEEKVLTERQKRKIK